MHTLFSPYHLAFIGACITHLLVTQPTDVALAMLDFCNHKKVEETRDDCAEPKEVPESAKPAIAAKAKKEQKLYLATAIGPTISKLVNRIATVRPQRVLDFVIFELNAMIYGVDEEADAPVFETYELEPHLPANYKISGPASPQKTVAELRESVMVAQENNQEENPYSYTPSSPMGHGVDAAPVLPSKTIQLAVLGAGNAGKSSLLNMLQGKFDPKIKPTLGFTPVAFNTEEFQVTFYDLGGGEKIRNIWDQYYHDVHAFIFVVDASQGTDELTKTVELYNSTFANAYTKMKPRLILANKQDVPGALKETDMASFFAVDEAANCKIFECSAIVGGGADSLSSPRSDYPLDPRLEQSLQWLLDTVKNNYGSLNPRVEIDVKRKQADEAKKRSDREVKILRNKIAAAFPAKLGGVNAESAAALGVPAEILANEAPEDCFDEEAGLAFLAAEVGEEAAALPQDARDIAALVGQQRLALQILGAFKAPISKKKVAMSWPAIKDLIIGIRAELGLL